MKTKYTITVEAKSAGSNDLEEAISLFYGMMCINRDEVRESLVTTGYATQVYGFVTGGIYDNEWPDG